MPVDLTIVESTTELGQTVVEVILEGASEPGPAGPGVPTGGTAGQVLTKDSGTDFDSSWQDAGGAGSFGPIDAEYLVGTANGTLTNEIVVGTAPGGELGGTWASPTVDATHSGSSHAAVQAAAEATAAAALSSHEGDTTSVHGIADTSVLATDSEVATAVSDHSADTTSVHGIADTSALYRSGGTDVAVADGGTGASTAAGARTNLDVPSNAEAILDALVDAKGDLIVATAADTPARLAVGTNGQVLTADSAETPGVKWADPAGGTVAAEDVTVADADGNFTGADVEAVLAELANRHKFVRKTATESVTSSTTLQDDDELLFAGVANAVYAVDVVAFVDGATGGDFKATIVGPAGATGTISLQGPQSGASTFDNHTMAEQSAGLGTAPVAGTLGAGNTIRVDIKALVILAGTAGNVKLQWAQQSSSGTATRVFANSYMIAHRIA